MNSNKPVKPQRPPVLIVRDEQLVALSYDGGKVVIPFSGGWKKYFEMERSK